MYIGNVVENNIDWNTVKEGDVFYGCQVSVSDEGANRKNLEKCFDAWYEEYTLVSVNEQGPLVKTNDDVITRVTTSRGIYKTKKEASESLKVLFTNMIKAIERLEEKDET